MENSHHCHHCQRCPLLPLPLLKTTLFDIGVQAARRQTSRRHRCINQSLLLSLNPNAIIVAAFVVVVEIVVFVSVEATMLLPLLSLLLLK